MAQINIEFERTIQSSAEIVRIASRLNSIKSTVEGMNLNGILDSSYSPTVNASLRRSANSLLDAAAKMNSLGSALELIANKYRAVEQSIFNSGESLSSAESNRQEKKDKRNWWQKFWDWLFGKQPDDHDTTTKAQERAADEAMRNQMREVLQDEMYSPEHWANASIEERKRILQAYMNAVIAIYGLQHVNANINWTTDYEYSENSITWGGYRDSNHTVTLNENALSDRYDTWDSYDLLETIGHELRHAYQHEAVNDPTRFMVSQDTIDQWRDNFEPGHYVRPEDDYSGYRNQPVEVDARNFQVHR